MHICPDQLQARGPAQIGMLYALTGCKCNRVLAVRRAGARGAAGRALSELWLHWSAAGACANSPPHPARRPRLAGSGELRPAGADTRHRHCDTPARRAGRPEGRAPRPKARSRPSTPNLDLSSEREVERLIILTTPTIHFTQDNIYHFIETAQGSSLIQKQNGLKRYNSLRGQMHVTLII